jgi:phosphoribosylglycinamide formyltransferase 1
MSLLCHQISASFSTRKRPVSKPFFYHIFTAFFKCPDQVFSMNEESQPIRIAIFASGQGTNAREIIRFFHQSGNLVLSRQVEVALIVCNKPGAGILDIAEVSGIPVILIDKEKFFRGSHYLEEFAARQISFIVLAGFLWKIPPELIRAYPDRILNLHPALLPHYGGKGMYGKAVHEAVLAAGERQSGISIHYVDEQYDHGRIFFQASFDLSPEETPGSLAERIHALEHKHYPEEIARWIEGKLS